MSRSTGAMVEGDRQVMGWVVHIGVDLRKVGYSGNPKSERRVGGGIGEVHRRVGEGIAVDEVDRDVEGGLGKCTPISRWERR